MDKTETFLAAIKANAGSIYKIAAIYTDTREDTFDMVQEIYYQLWKSFDSFSQKSALSTWIYRVAMNVAIYNLKQSKKKVRTEPIDDGFLNLDDKVDMDAEARWQILKIHIDELNVLDKGIVLLYMEDKSYEEIAEIIGISTSNVGTKLSRIKEKMKNQISKQVHYGTR